MFLGRPRNYLSEILCGENALTFSPSREIDQGIEESLTF